MPRKPKLVAITALVPTYMRDHLKRQAKRERRTVSGLCRDILQYSIPRKEKENYGEEKTDG